MELDSTLTCPRCGHCKLERMPEDACVVRYDCEACCATLRPQGTDCCVFCSFGSVACPPVQLHGKCCA